MSQEILGSVLELLRAEDPASRNRHFQQFEGRRGERVHRLFRLYRSLGVELEQAARRRDMRVRARRRPAGLELTVENPKVAYRRTCLVPPELDPYFRDILARLGLEAEGGADAARELLPVVDQHDRQVDVLPREEVHRRGLLHRAVHVLVFDQEDRLYLQLRSQNKDTHPGKWTSSASGHVDPGESYLQAARRELAEELGLELELSPLGFIPACPATENEFSQVYVARTGEPPRPAPAEIARGEFFPLDQARRLARDPTRAAPCLEPVLALLQPGRDSGSGG